MARMNSTACISVLKTGRWAASLVQYCPTLPFLLCRKTVHDPKLNQQPAGPCYIELCSEAPICTRRSSWLYLQLFDKMFPLGTASCYDKRWSSSLLVIFVHLPLLQWSVPAEQEICGLWEGRQNHLCTGGAQLTGSPSLFSPVLQDCKRMQAFALSVYLWAFSVIVSVTLPGLCC